MNIKTDIQEKFRIHTLSGKFNFDDLFQHIVDVYNDSNFNPSLSSVWDLTDVEGIQKKRLEEIQ